MKHRGSIYFLTLASSLVLVMAVMGLSFSIIQYRRTSRSNEQIDQAHIYAQLGIRHALFFTHQAPNWRNLLTSGDWMLDIPNGKSTYSVAGIDQGDGLLSNGDDSILLACMSNVNGIQRTITVQAEQPPLKILAYGVTCGSDLDFNNDAHIIGDVTANGNIKMSGSSLITGNLEVTGVIDHPDQVSGTSSIGVEAKTFPNSTDIVAYYTSLATTIPYQSSRYEEFLLSATNNPFGPTNANGVYLINCSNQKVEFKNCRIVATLILVNPKSDSDFNNGLNWQSPRPYYPALIVVNSLLTIQSDRPLNEVDLNTDFSMFVESGLGSLTDVYPNKITGLIYCTGELRLKKTVQVDGAIITEGLFGMWDNSVVNYFASLADNPPRMFKESYLTPIQDTWQEVTP